MLHQFGSIPTQSGIQMNSINTWVVAEIEWLKEKGDDDDGIKAFADINLIKPKN